MRPKPGLWLRLPQHIVDASTLAVYLRSYAALCTGTLRDVPQRQLLTAAAALDGCVPGDAEALRRVVEVLDQRVLWSADDPVLSDRRVWESIAHAVDRVADHVEWATDQGV